MVEPLEYKIIFSQIFLNHQIIKKRNSRTGILTLITMAIDIKSYLTVLDNSVTFTVIYLPQDSHLL
jgi:hypothetical protein